MNQKQYDRVLSIAANLCGTTLERARKDKTHDCTRARYMTWYVLATRYEWKQTHIALHSHGFDRTTVIYGINLIGDQKWKSADGQIVQAILDQLNC